MVLNYQNKFPYIARKVQTPPTLKQTTQTSKMCMTQAKTMHMQETTKTEL